MAASRSRDWDAYAAEISRRLIRKFMDIRQCREEDLDLLERHMPSLGRTRRHAMRFEKQQQGLSTFLVAWFDGIPVGTAQILWQGCEAPEVRERFSECPELNGLGVWPPQLRSQGIGTAIIRVAETEAHRSGHHQIGLGVDDQNLRAASLYLRLGYQETDCRYLDRYHYLDDNGLQHEVADACRFLIKQLTGRQPS